MKKRTKSEKITIYIALVIFILYAFTLIFPFFWLLLNSFKTNQDFFTNIWGLPIDWVFTNYVDAFGLQVRNFNLFMMFGNSVFIVIVGTFISMFVSSMAAYTISKYHFFGRRAIYMIAITVMLVPSVGTIPATYQFLQQTGLYNNYLGIFLMYSGGFGFSFIMLYGYFQNLSWSYAEAAFIDGCSDFRVFLQIMLPQAMPVLCALGIVQAINLWNDYFTPYMYMPQYPTLAVGLDGIVREMTARSNWPLLFATMLITIVPILAVFIRCLAAVSPENADRRMGRARAAHEAVQQ